ncbi:MAG: hypothetical protein M1829_001719 [Trizodia sp. TS-e1964]|nr:MAG: hypothetical protein M1829_001719 [Trizodia sp. TS-e1964]
MLLLFQHNNLTSVELMGIRRELAQALAKLDKAAAKDAGEEAPGIGANIKMQVINTALFAAALRVVEFYRPGDPPSPKIVKFKLKNHKPSSADDPSLTHSLSRAAYEAVANKKTKHALSPLFSGPLMVVNFPAASPQHLKAVLSILSPSQPQFPPPTRRSTPNYYDPHVQSGLQKLLLLGARIEGQVFDTEGIKYVGSIEGGLDGLRQQLVYLLQGVASGATNTLESAGRNLFLTIEGRRMMLEEEQNGLTQDKKAEN